MLHLLAVAALPLRDPPIVSRATRGSTLPGHRIPQSWSNQRRRRSTPQEQSFPGGGIGRGASDDGALDVELQRPPEMGGGGGGTNPEQLFAVGYAARFATALGVVARRQHIELGDVSALTPAPDQPNLARHSLLFSQTPGGDAHNATQTCPTSFTQVLVGSS
jgi:hypothetical protein